VQLMFPDLPPALPQVQAGKLVAIAVTSPQRAATLPSVPTTTESGYPGVVLESQYGLLTTGGVPAAALRTLNAAATEGLRQADVVGQLDKLGATASPTTPDEYRQLIATERTRWERVIKATGTKME
jgi:tripartite-type tricarboxylate transporter receptor subunit TctC